MRYDPLVDTMTDRSACWTFTESRPREMFGLIESIWHFEGSVPHARERHLPNGLIELVLQFGPTFAFMKGETREHCTATCLTGLQTSPTIIESPASRVCVLGVRLRPAGAYAVLGTPLHKTSERIVDLEDLIGDAASDIAERCSVARDGEARVRCAARWIAERIARSPGIDARVAWAAACIDGSHGAASIRQLEHHTGLSKKRFVAAFREQIGLAPKRYGRVVRFRRALGLIHSGGSSLTEVAVTAGYHDQAHMNRDFRRLGGLTPGEFLGTTRYSPTTTLG